MWPNNKSRNEQQQKEREQRDPDSINLVLGCRLLWRGKISKVEYTQGVQMH